MAKIKKHGRKTMFLRTELATGEAEGKKFEMAMNIDNKCLIWTFPEAIYTVGAFGLTEEVLNFRKKNNGEQNEKRN